jgi:hypothetical protein
MVLIESIAVDKVVEDGGQNGERADFDSQFGSSETYTISQKISQNF